ncbi:MAG: hypothetical protein LBT57_02920 [Puniceicoccales bacterium]|nr:hypothetical protein [Puniceicoccales bacterium]
MVQKLWAFRVTLPHTPMYERERSEDKIQHGLFIFSIHIYVYRMLAANVLRYLLHGQSIHEDIADPTGDGNGYLQLIVPSPAMIFLPLYTQWACDR